MQTTTRRLTEAEIDQNKHTAARHHIALETGDTSDLDEILAPGWLNHPIQFNEGDGVEGFKQKSRWFHSQVTLHFDLQDISADNDKVWIRTLVTGQVRGEFMGHDMTGRKVAFNTLECHRFVDGKIVESWHLQDYYAMLVQMGAIPNVMNAQTDPYPGWN